MRLTLRVLARCLSYPSAELQAHISELRDALVSEGVLPLPARTRLDSLLERLGAEDLLKLQSEYSELFDRSRSLSLHLFEHVHGDSRERGQAMIDLGQQYLRRGFLLAGAELPDFIPAFLEFASCLSPAEARELIAEPAHVFAALEERLAKRESPYAAVFGALVAAANTKLDRQALADLEARAPSDDPAKIDEEWEEKAVTFTGPVEMGGPTGAIAKFRAAAKAMVRSTSARRPE